MASFCIAFNCSNSSWQREKQVQLQFSSTVKKNCKEGLKLSKVRREKILAQIFSKSLTERKLERTKMKIMLSASPSSAFLHKVNNITFEKQIRILS